MNATTATSVAGSDGLTLKSCVCRNRVRRNDAPTPDGQAHDGERHALAEHHPEHALPRGAHRHVNADLFPALAHRVPEDAVGADRGQRERQSGGNHQQLGQESWPRDRLGEHFVHGAQLDERQRRVHPADHAPDVGGERVERQRRSDHDVHVARRRVDDARSLIGKKVDLGAGLLRARHPA